MAAIHEKEDISLLDELKSRKFDLNQKEIKKIKIGIK